MIEKRLSLAPSGASRWTKCTASPGYIADHPELVVREEQDFTTEGVQAHNAAAMELLAGVELSDVRNTDMLRHVKAWGDFVRKETPADAEFIIEREIELWYMKGRRGFLDYTAYSRRLLKVIDLKYGMGVAVYAEDNDQLLIYARSIYEELRQTVKFHSDARVELIIFQPRCQHGAPITRWVLTVAEMVRLSDKIGRIADEIQSEFSYDFPQIDENGDVVPSSLKFRPSDDTCRFCDASPFCKARTEWLLSDTNLLTDLTADTTDIVAYADTPQGMLEDPLESSPETIVLPDPSVLDARTRALLVKKKAAIVKWLDRVEGWCFAQLEHGHRKEVPGLKLVRGRRGGNRTWSDEERAGKLLVKKLPKGEVYKTTVISPSQAEELLKAHEVQVSTKFGNILAELTTKKGAGLTMVPVEDPRDDASPQVDISSEFDNLEHLDLLDEILS